MTAKKQREVLKRCTIDRFVQAEFNVSTTFQSDIPLPAGTRRVKDGGETTRRLSIGYEAIRD
jgi:hypothetical protein